MADFYTYRSLWDLEKPHALELTPGRFYERRCRQHHRMQQAPELHRALAERRWTENECVYYRSTTT